MAKLNTKRNYKIITYSEHNCSKGKQSKAGKIRGNTKFPKDYSKTNKLTDNHHIDTIFTDIRETLEEKEDSLIYRDFNKCPKLKIKLNRTDVISLIDTESRINTIS